jgi:hypothetical protein
VKNGEKGIRILAPVIGIRRKKDTEATKDIRTQNQPVLVGFRSAWVPNVIVNKMAAKKLRSIQ